MKTNKKIFIDLDGVMADWEGKAAELMGVNYDEIAHRMKEGENFQKLFPKVWDTIYANKEDFWSKLDKFPWADDLYTKMTELGEVSFLTSMGNFNRNTDSVAYASYGKIKWVAEHFPESKLILTREKYFCADKDSILIDDTYDKVKDFKAYGGEVFHFPHAYKLKSGEIEVSKMLGELEEKILSM